MGRADMLAAAYGASLLPGAPSLTVLMKTKAVTYPSMSTRKHWLPLVTGFPLPLSICYIPRMTRVARVV